MQKKNDNKAVATRFVLVSLLILAVALLIAAVTNVILSLVYSSDKPVTHVVGMLDGIIGAIATGLVLFQLRMGDKTEKRQNDIEEASFILQFNQAFIQDANMVEVEHLLESQVYYFTEPKEILTQDNRQKFINYLVYLESLAPLVLNGVFSLEHIDNLMAYRFFLAVDNSELQEKEIKPFAEYYRGCFKLYKVWRAYRIDKKFDCPCDDCKNRDTMMPLDRWEEFEKYSS